MASLSGQAWRQLVRASGLILLMLWAGVLAMLMLVAPLAHATDDVAAYLDVRERGIYRVSFDDLASAGIDFSRVDVNDLAMSFDGQPVSIFVSDRAGRRVVEGTFGPEHFVEFLARVDETPYRGRAVYLLESDPDNALRADLTPLTDSVRYVKVAEHIERWAPNRLHSRISPVSDPWFARRLVAYRKPASARISFMLDSPVPRLDESATLVAVLWGGNNDRNSQRDHRAEVYVNDVRVATRQFDGVTAREIEAKLAPGVLQSGRNVVEVRTSNGGGAGFSVVGLESIELRYPGRLTVHDGRASFVGGRPGYAIEGFVEREVSVWRVDANGMHRVRARVEAMTWDGGLREERRRFWRALIDGNRDAAARYEVASASAIETPAIRKATSSDDLNDEPADFLVVAHSDLYGASLDRLLAERRSEGRQIKLVNVSSIYRTWSSGNKSAEAIRRYVRWAAQNLGVRELLLVGGDTFDYRNRLRGARRGSARSLIPTLYASAAGNLRHEPADPLFGDIDGDGVQDISVGRLPVQTIEELDSVVERILNYPVSVNPQSAFVMSDQDREELSFAYSDTATETLASIPENWSADALALAEGQESLAKDKLKSLLEDGVALTVWIGSSGHSGWGLDPVLSSIELGQVTEQSQPSVVTQIGCCGTWLVDPRRQSLGHQWMTGPIGKAVAVFGTGTRVASSAEKALSIALTTSITRDRMTLGEALVVAKRSLIGQFPARVVRQVSSAYTLLGDPSLRVPTVSR